MLDLDAYLRRIGLGPAGSPDLVLLRAVVAAHAAAIPFENLAILLGRPIPLDIAAIEAKLVRSRRGGYCFEQNTLLHAALQALGFAVEFRMARVVRGAPPESVTPRTHLLLRVALPQGAYVADVGFGNLTPTAPLPFGIDLPQQTPHETFRLTEADGLWTNEVLLGDAWQPVYQFPDTPVFPIDAEVANWFTCTKPGGKFTANGIAALPGEQVRKTLLNGAVTLRWLDGTQERFRPQGPVALRAALVEHFGIELALGEAEAVFSAMARFAEIPVAGFE